MTSNSMMKKNEIVLSYDDTLLRESDVKILDSCDWLNDNLISFWFSYLQNTLISSDAFSYYCVCPEMCQLIKSSRNSPSMLDTLKHILGTDPYNVDVLFLAINDCDFEEAGGNHWSLLVFYKNTDQPCKAEHYDSIHGNLNIKSAKLVANILNQIFCTDKEVRSIDVVEISCIKQINGYDCGIHTLCNTEALIKILFFDNQNDLNSLASLQVIKNKRNHIKQTIEELRAKLKE